MLESADACGVGLAAVSGDVVESTNYILKKGYNGHTSRCGGAGKSAVEREAMVVQQVWEWWFLSFDLPFLHDNTPHTAACTAASLLSTTPIIHHFINRFIIHLSRQFRYYEHRIMNAICREQQHTDSIPPGPGSLSGSPAATSSARR